MPQGCKDTYAIGTGTGSICNYSSCPHGKKGWKQEHETKDVNESSPWVSQTLFPNLFNEFYMKKS